MFGLWVFRALDFWGFGIFPSEQVAQLAITRQRIYRLLTRPLLMAFACLSILSTNPGLALANGSDDMAEARKLFRAAEEDENQLRWADALDKLERVVAIRETAGVRFHIAVCQEKLGMLVKAIQNFERSRELANASGSRDVLEMVGTELAQVRTRVAGVVVTVAAGVGPVVVEVGGAVYRGVLSGAVIDVDPGTHTVVVKVGDSVRVRTEVSLAEGQRKTVAVGTAAAPGSPPVSGSSEAPGSSDGNQTANNDVSATVDRRSVPTPAWVAFGAGAALAVGGVLAYSKAGSVAADSADVCAIALECDPKRRDVVRKWDAAAMGMWVAAGVGLGVGVGLVLISRDGKPTTTLVVSPSQVGVRTAF